MTDLPKGRLTKTEAWRLCRDMRAVLRSLESEIKHGPHEGFVGSAVEETVKVAEGAARLLEFFEAERE